MKRALGLTFIVIACVIGFLSIRGAMPFMPIFGSSMEPELQSGSLIMIEPVGGISEVEVGDIIVYNVPRLIREYYNYPPVIAHRVIKVITDHRGTGFRTAGDNSGEDPFGVTLADLRGKVGDQIPYAGLPLLFFQSQQGMMFIITALSLLAIFLYSGELGQGKKKLHRVIFTPVIEESYRTNRVLVRKIESTEQKMDTTQQALEKFAAAIEVYAEHLSSHTSAIQGLSEASQELKKSSAEQNRFLMHLMESMGQPRPEREETITRIEPTMVDLEKTAPQAEKMQFPPGCVRSRQTLLKRINEVSLKL